MLTLSGIDTSADGSGCAGGVDICAIQVCVPSYDGVRIEAEACTWKGEPTLELAAGDASLTLT